VDLWLTGLVIIGTFLGSFGYIYGS